MHISFVIPTRNRQHELAYTLEQLERLSLHDLGGGSEVVVVDNGSDRVMELPRKLSNGIRVTATQLGENRGTGARNIGAEHARGDWVIMLDDDSNLCQGPVGEYLSNVDTQVAAVGGEIILPSGQHESGGLPEVIVGCGCAIRREVFLNVGGYDERFGYYAEEYDLCAKLIAAGHSILHTMALRFEHRKSVTGRNMNEILFRLVRNNGWVIQRYAPSSCRSEAFDEMYARYKEIAIKEDAVDGYRRGCAELVQTLEAQRLTPLSASSWDRFIGVSAVRESLSLQLEQYSCAEVSVVGSSWAKGYQQICGAIESLGHVINTSKDRECIEVIGSLSPGPMLDARLIYPDAICPWQIEDRLIEDSASLRVHS